MAAHDDDTHNYFYFVLDRDGLSSKALDFDELGPSLLQINPQVLKRENVPRFLTWERL